MAIIWAHKIDNRTVNVLTGNLTPRQWIVSLINLPQNDESESKSQTFPGTNTRDNAGFFLSRHACKNAHDRIWCKEVSILWCLLALRTIENCVVKFFMLSWKLFFSMRLHSVVLVILKISNHLETHLDALKPRKISLQTWCFDAVVMNFVIIHLMPQRHFSSFVAEKSFFSPLFTTTTQHIEILITIKN